MRFEDDTTSFTVSVAVGRLSRPMKCAALENLSITERITDFPVETGKSVTKTREIWEQGCDKPRQTR